MISRRSLFLRGAGAALVAAASGSHSLGAATPGAASNPAPIRLGSAGYTFLKFKLEATLEMLRKVDVHFLCIKDFHLPLKSTDEEIAAFHEKCRNLQVTGYGVGPIYMGNEVEVRQAFAYARRVGVKTLVGVPFKMVGDRRVASAELLKLVHDLVQEYDLRYAIHHFNGVKTLLLTSGQLTIGL